MTELVLDGVSAAHGDRTVLAGLDLRVSSGSLTALMGPSGSGKTTVVRVLAGFHRAASGNVRIGDRVVDGPTGFVRPEKRGVGVVAQQPALFGNLDVAGNIGYGTRRWGRIDRRRVAELLEQFDLGGLGSHRISQLSPGQQQLVAIARALAPRPAALLLDEPFSELDPQNRGSARLALRSALREDGATGLLVTHEPLEARLVADQMLLMRHGRLVQAGSPDELYQRPVSLWAARFLGAMVELPADGDAESVSTPLGVLPVAEVVRDPAATRPVAVLSADRVVADPGGVDGRVAKVIHLGPDRAVVVVHVIRPGGGVLGVPWRVDGCAPDVGERVRIRALGPVRVFAER